MRSSVQAAVGMGSRFVRAVKRSPGRAVMIVAFAFAGRASAAVIYVDDSAPAGGDGQTWATACQYLQDGLAAAGALGSDATEIRIGQGTYRPDESQANPSGSGDRNATFKLVDGVVVRGGYAGFGAADPDEYDPTAFASVLSGDLLGDDLPNFVNYADNSIHVVTAPDVNADLRGCVVRGGNANGPLLAAFGGGVLCQLGTLHLTDCRFEANTADNGGGAFVIDSVRVVFRNITVTGNRAGFGGGGVFVQSHDSQFLSCTFQDNRNTSGEGGGLHQQGFKTTLEDCDFVGNQNTGFGGFGGGARIQGQAVVRHCNFHQNSATASGGGLFARFGGVVVTHCTFTANSGEGGGGLCASQTNPTTIMHCAFEDNSAETGGGLLAGANGASLVHDCVFRNNSAWERGGGLRLDGQSAQATNLLFESNAVTKAFYDDDGGGGCHTSTTTDFRNCRFFSNTSVAGGGALCSKSNPPTIVGCLFSGNDAGLRGGALRLERPGYGSILNCTIVDNSAGGAGGGIHVSGIDPLEGFEINNSILWSNRDVNGTGQAAQLSIDSASPIMQYSCLQNLTTNFGPGNVSFDPQFIDADGPDNVVGTIDDDLRLLASSPLIDAGGNFFFRFCALDLDGGDRKTDDPAVPDTGGGGPPLPDMGAYERLAIVHDDCNANALDDDCDLLSIPGSDCDGSGALDACEINAGVVPDCNFNGKPDSCDFASGAALDCNANGIPDSCDIANGASIDCNVNGVPDSCEIAARTVPDCDNNGRPDSCDRDGNLNGAPDACDIASGVSIDCDGDGAPDDAQISAAWQLGYVLDDGSGESAAGVIINGQNSIWLNSFTVQPGGEVVTGIELAWSEANPGQSVTVALWRDPNGDGDPGDAELLATHAITVPASAPFNLNPPTFFLAPLPPTSVGPAGTIFFAGASMLVDQDTAPLALDFTAPHQGRSWIAAGGNLANLAQNPFPVRLVSQVFGGQSFDWLMRARAGSAVDQNLNGILDICKPVPGDVNGDGAVDVDDLLAVINAWGPCPAPPDPCLADIAPGRSGDGLVNVDDLLAVINGWTS